MKGVNKSYEETDYNVQLPEEGYHTVHHAISSYVFSTNDGYYSLCAPDSPAVA